MNLKTKIRLLCNNAVAVYIPVQRMLRVDARSTALCELTAALEATCQLTPLVQLRIHARRHGGAICK